MDIIKKVRGDRSGVSTLLIAIIIVLIVVIIAVAVYFILVGTDNYEKTFAPGTTMTYDVTWDGVEMGTLEQTIVGQNSTEYFVMSKSIGDAPVTQYSMLPKGIPDYAVSSGTEDIETFEGTKTLTVWEYSIFDSSVSPQAVTAYVDPENGVAYKNVIVYTNWNSNTASKETEVQILTAYHLVRQKSYNESYAIHPHYDYYESTDGASSSTVTVTCVADCLNNQYGMRYDFGNYADYLNVYFLSKEPRGLPADAVDTGQTTTLSTIYGNVTAEIWSASEDGYGFTFYYDSGSHLICRFVLSSGGNEMSFDYSGGLEGGGYHSIKSDLDRS